jgi:Tfp pilus assembly protein PilN
MKNRLLQAYKQAPWRIQMQWIGLFLLALVILAALAGLYLNINAKAAEAGRNIQFLESNIEDINNEIAELTTDLAEVQSTGRMMTRARELGFTMINPQAALYLKVPGYIPNDQLVLASGSPDIIKETPIIQSSYKDSLWDWLVKSFWQISGDSTDEGGTP